MVAGYHNTYLTKLLPKSKVSLENEGRHFYLAILIINQQQ